MIVKTNVKLNLGLSVLRKRADGFHDIETLFVPCFDFGDTIEIITGDDYSRSSAALFAKYGAPDGRFDASTGSVTGRLSDRQEASVGEPVEPHQPVEATEPAQAPRLHIQQIVPPYRRSAPLSSRPSRRSAQVSQA